MGLSITVLADCLYFAPICPAFELVDPMRYHSLRRLLLVLPLLLPLMACSSTVYKPTILHPGPAYFQRNNAMQFDPYPPNDLGPEIVGGRPIDFQKPVDEVRRARQQNPIAPWRQAPLY